MNEPRVRNAADSRQVEKARKDEKRDAQQLLLDTREVLNIQSGAGQRVIWHLIEQCKVFESVWHPSALIHYQAGQQDVGHLLLSLVMDAHPAALLKMMQERLNKRKEKDDA
jgi:hypothetical protein